MMVTVALNVRFAIVNFQSSLSVNEVQICMALSHFDRISCQYITQLSYIIE